MFGIYGHPQAAELTYFGLYALQHRGQESAGIVSSDGEQMYIHRGMGLVGDVFAGRADLDRLKGYLAIGHNRYSTTGSTLLVNAQPLLVNYKSGPLAIAHNGNLVNSRRLRNQMEGDGSIFQTTLDNEVIVHLTARSRAGSITEGITDALSRVKGAYSLLFATTRELIGVRDPMGFRPLCLGRLDGGFILTSESCALDIVGAEYIRDVEPGEMIVVDEHGVQSIKPLPKTRYAFCIFEYIYFSRPDSKVFGDNVDKARRNLGRQLAMEKPAEADIAISVPDSSNTTTLGYSEISGTRLELGLIRNHYIGRTFINPSQATRDLGVRIKYNPVQGVLKDRRVVVVDDSIVRGTTSKKLMGMIRNAGAKEIHLRISSPPITHPCFYGIDTPTREELIAANHTVEEIGRHLGVDSLEYLSIEGLLKAMPHRPEDYCVACFSGQYPVEPEDEVGKFILERGLPVEPMADHQLKRDKA